MIIKKIKNNLKKIPSFKKIVVGVSGGADSVALAYFLHKLGYKIIIAHLNHSLRWGASDRDAEFVQKLSKKLDVPCVIKKVVISHRGNLENNARQVRYAFLEEVRKKYKAKYIATGHHQDDQVETILMHLCRGAGLRGLRGMQLQNGHIIRPLLDTSKKEILNFLQINKLSYREDQSNYDLNYQRNYLRHIVIPDLRVDQPDLENNLLFLSDQIKPHLKNIEKKAQHWLARNLHKQVFDRIKYINLSDELRGEILIQILGPDDLYRKTITRLIDFIQSGKTGKHLTVKEKTFYLEYNRVKIKPALCKQVTPCPKKRLSKRGIKWGNWHIRTSYKTPLFVRTWQAGDRFCPTGMKGSKKLQDFFVDKKISRPLRNQIPIIVDENDQIMSVGDMRFDRHAIDLKKTLKIKTL